MHDRFVRRRGSKATAWAVSAVAAAATTLVAAAQQPPANGMRPADLRAHAITGATVITAPGMRLEGATILIRDGVIEAVGAGLEIPPDAKLWSAEGMTVYPGLIDAAVLIRPGDRAASAGAHWNGRIHPELNMAEHPPPSANVRRQLRELGFTAAAVYPDSGMFRGTGHVIALADESEHVLSYRDRAAMAAAFDYGGRRAGGGYPGSLMGAIALMRQTLYDVRWHEASRRIYDENPEGHEPPVRADALVALADVIHGRQPVLFDASDEQNALRAARIAREFDLDMILLGSGMEFRRLDEVLALDMPIVLPMRFPDRPSVTTLEGAESTTLREMMTWEQAPTNARRLVEGGATVALTTHRLNRRRDFPAAVRRAIEFGLDEDAALAALTTVPAKLLGLERVIGTIEPGKAANLVVVEGTLFDREAKIRDTWINGRRHEITKIPDIEFVGKGVLRTDRGDEIEIQFDSTRSRISLTLPDGKQSRAQNVTVQCDQISFVTDGRAFDVSGYVRLSGVLTRGVVIGSGVLPDRREFTFTIEPVENGLPDDADEEDAQPVEQVEEPDTAPPADADDGVTGEWMITTHVEGMPEPIPVTLSLSLHEDGSVTGVSIAMGMESEIQRATFDPITGELRYSIDTPGGSVDLHATIDGESIRGRFAAQDFQGEFSGTRRAASSREEVAAKPKETIEFPPDELPIPLGAFGLYEPLRQQDVIVHGATLWTAGPDGIIERGWMYVRDGKIAGIGEGDAPSRLLRHDQNSNRLIIDGSGKHVTPGLIDCHSHTGITGGVNEWAQVNTAEVRIADVINPDDVNWYRQLAGGLTAANQLHGSANPIGGQNSVVKLKWGGTAEDMLVDDAIAGIKFALGENVVRSQSRYPNTRMGVETVLRDAFNAAREYDEKWKRYHALPDRDMRRTMPPRRDLTLDALAEILRGERLVHCHSYRQDEILMLIRVAEYFGFTIGTLQHVLEGYKVAEAIAEHGAGASAFSDWWGYKVEVMDAIPHAGALMHHVGVNVSFNSDSSELARRMNIEAAKAVRYGNVPVEEAIKFVTLNPAIQLQIDHRTGSLEEGKDADFVIWSGDPLSVYTRCEQTWIEGVRYFDLQQDRARRQRAEEERERLIQKILADAHGRPSEPTGPENRDADAEPEAGERERPSRLMARLIENRRRMMEEQYRLGLDPEELQPGDCGCNDFWFDMMYFGLKE